MFSLRTRLGLLVAGALLPVFILAIVTSLQSQSEGLQRAGENLLAVARLEALGQERMVEGAHQLLDAIVSAPLVRSRNSSECVKYFVDLKARYPTYANLGVLGLDGMLACHAIDMAGDRYAGDRLYLKEALATQAFVAGEYIVGRATGSPSLSFALPVFDDANQLKSVAFAALDLSRIGLKDRPYEQPANTHIAVTDRNGVVLWAGGVGAAVPGKKYPDQAMYDAIASLPSGAVQHTDSQGTPRLYAVAAVRGTARPALFVIASIRREDVVAPIQRQLVVELLWLALVTLFGLLVARWVGSKAVLAPARQLLQKIERLGNGQSEAKRELEGGDEFAQLSGAFDATLQRLRHREAERDQTEMALNRTRDRLLVAQRIGKMGCWELEIATGTLWWSDEIYEIFAVSRDAFAKSYESFADFIHPDDLLRFQDAQARALNGEQALDIEHRILTATGEVRWVHEVGELVRGPDGSAAQLAGIVQDITHRKTADARLRLLESAVSRLNDIVLITEAEPIDEPGPRIVFVNEAFERRTGYTSDEAIGRSPRFLQGPKTQRPELDRIRKSLEKWQPVRAELINYTKSGQELWLELDIVPIADPTGSFTHWVSIERDVTARRHLEEERDRLFNLSTDLLAVGSFDGRLEQVNPGWTKCLGWSAQELTSRPWLDFVHLEDRPATISAGERLALGHTVQDFQNRYLCKDGSPRWISWNSYPLVETRQIFSVARDITDQKRSQAALADSHRAMALLGRCSAALIRCETEPELLASVCQIAVDVGSFRLAWIGYAQDDPQKRVVPQAHAGVENGYLAGVRITWSETDPTGYAPAGVVIRSGEPLIVPDLKADPTFAPWLQSALEHGFRGVLCLPLKDSSRTFGVLVLYMPEVRVPLEEERKLLNELAANLAFGIGTIRAKVERDRIESAVLQVASSVSAVSNDNFFMELARSMTRATGAQAGFVARVLPGEPHRVRTIAAVMDERAVLNFDYVLQGTPCEGLLTADECVVPAEVAVKFPRSSSLAEFGAQAYVGRRLVDSMGRLSGVLFVLFRDPLGAPRLAVSTLQILAARAGAELERQETDLKLREQAELLDHAQDAILVRDLDHRIKYWNAGAERLYGWSAAEAMGRSVRDLFYPDHAQFDRALQELQRDRQWRGRLDQVDKHGRKLVVEGRWTAMLNHLGEPNAVLVINTDITDRLAMEEQLRQVQRLESVGQLTGGVSHDFNNLLTVILGNAEVLSEHLASHPKLAPLAGMVVSAAERGAQLTQRLLAFSRKQPLAPQSVDANALVAGMEVLLRRTLGEHVAIRVVPGAGLWASLVDPAQLEGAVLNLCINSRDAMPEGGYLTIETSNAQLDEAYTAQHADVQPGEYVMVAVSDTGCGIAAGDLSRVFEPFYTTKPKGKGTGLGLSMVYGFVKQSRGHVSIYSEPGKGTTIKLYLPRTSMDGEAIEVRPEVVSRGGAEMILLVEDDELVRWYASEQLRSLGYTVIEAGNGAEALTTIEQQGNIDLLFTDVVMPGMSGRELADAAQRLRPGLKVLYTSGYTDDAIVHQGRLDPGVHLLSKPYRRAELAGKVRNVLG